MQAQDDANLIRRSLTDRLEQLLDSYAPGWIKDRGAAYPAPKSKADPGSFRVNLSGQRRGSWYRFSQSVGGGSVELLSYLMTGAANSYREAFQEARRFLGIDRSSNADSARSEAIQRQAAESENRRRQEEQRDRAAKERRRDDAGSIWARCCPIDGTLAEEYLAETRGIPAPPAGWPADLGYHPGLLHETGMVYPCLIARVSDVSGLLTAVWRIFLDPLTGHKADVANAKMGLGPSAGGAARLGGTGPRIGVAEGVETALAVAAILGWKKPVWAALSTSGMTGLDLPLQVDHVSIFPDGDPLIKKIPGSEEFAPERLPPGLRAGMKLRDKLRAARVGVSMNSPPSEADFADVLKDIGLPKGRVSQSLAVAS